MKNKIITYVIFFTVFYTSINHTTAKFNRIEKKTYIKLFKASRTLSQTLPQKFLYGTVSITEDSKEIPLISATVTIYSRYDSIISSQTDSLGHFSINITDQFKKLNNPFYLFVRHLNNFKNTTRIYKNFNNPIKIIVPKSNPSKIGSQAR